MKKYLSIAILFALLVVLPASLVSAAPAAQGEDYTVQADDWLSKLAEGPARSRQKPAWSEWARAAAFGVTAN